MQNLHFKLTSKYPKYNNWHQTKHHNTIHWGVFIVFTLLVFGTISRWTPITFAADIAAPTTPTNLTAIAVSPSQINLSWTASTDDVGVTGYKIYRCAGSACAPTTQIATSATNSYSNTGLTASTAYTYAVSAYDAAGNEGGKSTSVSATTQIQTGNVYYISPTGSNTTGNGSSTSPWQTITFATGKMVGGDTLILKDGTYYNSSRENMISPPSGSPGNYFIVKAENNWKAIIDGQGFQMYSNYPVNIKNKSYIQIEGIKIVNGSSDAAIAVDNSSYIKLMRISIKNGVPYNATYGNVIVIIGGSHHVLVEDSWVTGSMRYGVIVYGGDGSGTNKIILRRVVVRWDYIQSNQPKAAFAFYGSIPPLTDPTVRDIMCQNCIAIDTNPGDAYQSQYGGFLNNKYTLNNKYYGSIALNIKASGGTDTISTGFHLGSNESNLTKGNEVNNSVAWDTSGNTILFYGGDPIGTTLVNQSTIGQSGQRGIYNLGNTQFIAKNSLFYNNPQANSGVTTSSYNSYTPASQAQGTNYITSDPLMKYITRIETNSPAYQSGEGGVTRGAEIIYRYGVSGTLWDEPGFDQLTNIPIWPWPYEDQIKADFSETNDPPVGAYPTTNNTKRGFVADGMTLTKYIWEYLGNPCPVEICSYGPDTTPPLISQGLPSGTLPAGTTSTTLSVTTNENASCKYSTTPNVAYTLISNAFLTTGATTHSTTLYGLQNGQTYNYYVKCQDSASNSNPNDFAITFSIAVPDTIAPVISSVLSSSITSSSATITWTTDELSDSQTEYGITTSYGTLATLDTNLVTSHSQTIINLQPNTLYHYIVRSKDSSGNLAASNDFTFTTTDAPIQNCAATNILCVDDTPGPTQEYSTIQAAANVAKPGDTVLGYDGTYAGFQVVTSGTSASSITFRANGTSVVINSGSITGDGIRLQNVNYISVEGFTIQNTPQRCIAARGATATAPMNGLVIKNNVCIKGSIQGLYLSQVSNSLIENNNISGILGEGGVEGHGIYLANAGSDNTIIRGNVIHDNNGSPSSQGIHINGDISIGGDGIISGLSIENNTIYNNSTNGINMDGVQNSVIQNNLVYGNGRHALRAYQIDGAQGPKNLKIINNTFHTTSTGGWAIKISEDLGGHTIFNNILMSDNLSTGSISVNNLNFTSNYNAMVDRLSFNNETTIVTLASWKASGYDTNSLISLPVNLFTNPSTASYTLKAGSPAIDQGIALFNTVSAPENDIINTSRPQGVAYDLGAYEVSIGSDIIAPSVPTGLSVTPVSSSQINLTWTASTDDVGVAGYKIYRCAGSACSPTTQIASSATNFYSNTGLTASTTYTYAISAYDAAGNESGKSSSVSATTLSQFKPSDLNQDQKVDQQDFDILKQDWNRTDKPKSDLNQDGIVDSRDLGIMMSEWTR